MDGVLEVLVGGLRGHPRDAKFVVQVQYRRFRVYAEGEPRVVAVIEVGLRCLWGVLLLGRHRRVLGVALGATVRRFGFVAFRATRSVR